MINNHGWQKCLWAIKAAIWVPNWNPRLPLFETFFNYPVMIVALSLDGHALLMCDNQGSPLYHIRTCWCGDKRWWDMVKWLSKGEAEPPPPPSHTHTYTQREGNKETRFYAVSSLFLLNMLLLHVFLSNVDISWLHSVCIYIWLLCFLNYFLRAIITIVPCSVQHWSILVVPMHSFVFQIFCCHLSVVDIPFLFGTALQWLWFQMPQSYRAITF